MNLSVSFNAVSDRRGTRAFTLLEVLVAIGIFFIAIFAILDLVMHSVRAAHSLSKIGPTAAMQASMLTTSTNILPEGGSSGDFEEFPGYTWEAFVEAWNQGTNGLYLVKVDVFNRSGALHDSLTFVWFSPQTASGSSLAAAAANRIFDGGSSGGAAARTGGGSPIDRRNNQQGNRNNQQGNRSGSRLQDGTRPGQGRR